MSEQLPVKRTVVSMRDYARAVIRAWHLLFNDLPAKDSLAVLWGQYMVETGGAACWNWNVGNVKHVEGDGKNWHELRDVLEYVTTTEADLLILHNQAKLSTHADHIRAAPHGKVAVLFNPPHPATRFVAYASLDEAMMTHLAFLAKRFSAAWEEVERGNPNEFAHALKAGRDGKEGTWDDYFTASAEVYAQGIGYHFKNFMNSVVFDEELGVVLARMNVPTIPPGGIPDDTPTRPYDIGNFEVVHQVVDTLAPLRDGDDPDKA